MSAQMPSLEIFEWHLTDCHQTYISLHSTRWLKSNCFEYQDLLTHLDASELPGSLTIPQPSSQAQGISEFDGQKKNRFIWREAEHWAEQWSLISNGTRQGTMRSESTSTQWLAILIGVSMLLQSVQSNIYVHFSVKWDWKTKDSIAKQETKVQKKWLANQQCVNWFRANLQVAYTIYSML